MQEAQSILWLTQGGPTLPSVRFRVLPILEEAQGHFALANATRLPKTFLARLKFYLNLKRTDIIILQKRLISPLELALLRRKCRLLVYDFDDAVWTEQDDPREPQNGQHYARFCRVVKNVDLVIAGNAYLAAALPAGVKHFLMPSPIDAAKYAPAQQDRAGNPHEPALPLASEPGRPLVIGSGGPLVIDPLVVGPLVVGPFVIGWMGTEGYLPMIKDRVYELAAAGFNLRLVSSRAPEYPLPQNVSFEIWSAEREAEQLQGFDIGLMPLEDTPYTRGKCGFKILQYMACGVVPLASAIGMNNDIIRHGENGLLAQSGANWPQLAESLKNPAERQRMAQAARQDILDNYDVKAVANAALERLKSELRLKLSPTGNAPAPEAAGKTPDETLSG